MNDQEIIQIFQNILDEEKKQTKILEDLSKDTKEQKEEIGGISWYLLSFFIFYIVLPILFFILSFVGLFSLFSFISQKITP